jgi:hypothetical protein
MPKCALVGMHEHTLHMLMCRQLQTCGACHFQFGNDCIVRMTPDALWGLLHLRKSAERYTFRQNLHDMPHV